MRHGVRKGRESMTMPQWHFWIDRGGTFTDLVGRAPSGELVVRKVLSEPTIERGDPAVRAIREVLGLPAKAPIPPGVIQEVRLGTTVATNALLEGAGEPVLLITNQGLADLSKLFPVLPWNMSAKELLIFCYGWAMTRLTNLQAMSLSFAKSLRDISMPLRIMLLKQRPS